MAASDPDRVQAGYGQLMFWLAQMRAGVPKPEFIERTPGDGWPQPLLLYMRGEYTEAELIVPVRRGDDDDNPQPNTSTDERLCEALFYVGEAYWARGQLDVARDYFAALVNIRVIYFLEHGLALAEIAKLKRTPWKGKCDPSKSPVFATKIVGKFLAANPSRIVRLDVALRNHIVAEPTRGTNNSYKARSACKSALTSL